MPPDSVWCTRVSNSELLTFGNSGGRSAISHRTVRCASGATATLAPTVACNRIECATVRTDVRLMPEGAPDSVQDLSGAPPDCRVPQKTEAPTVRFQRPGDVAGAPDSVRWRTGLSGAPCGNEKFNPEHPDAVWCSDITYIWTYEGFVYLTSIMDLYSRKIIWFPSKRCVTVNFMVFRRQNSKYYMPDLLNWLILEDDCSSSSF